MKVYVVVKEYVNDDGADTEVKVYSTYWKAKEYFDEEVNWLKENDPLIASDFYDEDLSETCYSLWKLYNYNENHVRLYISEEVVDE